MDSNIETLIPITWKGYLCYRTIFGAVGMSKRVLADICDIDVTAIDYILANSNSEIYAPWFSQFTKQNAILTRQKLGNGRGKRALVLTLEFCQACIDYYEEKKRVVEQETVAASVIHDGYQCYKTRTGAIGMTKQSLADTCSVTESAIDHLLKKLTDKLVPEWLTPFINEDLVLTRVQPMNRFTKGGPHKVVFRLDFCLAVIAHYQRKAQEKEQKQIRLVYLRKITN